MKHRYWMQQGGVWKIGFFLLGLLLAMPGWAQAQSASDGLPPEFEVNAVSVRGEAEPGLTRVDIYTKVPYARLRFINTANGFTANYEVTAEVFALDDQGRMENLALTRIWESKAIVNTFVATQSLQLYDRSLHSVDLPPGATRSRSSSKTRIPRKPLCVRYRWTYEISAAPCQ